jgi:hypothetical protein
MKIDGRPSGCFLNKDASLKEVVEHFKHHSPITTHEIDGYAFDNKEPQDGVLLYIFSKNGIFNTKEIGLLNGY